MTARSIGFASLIVAALTLVEFAGRLVLVAGLGLRAVEGWSLALEAVHVLALATVLAIVRGVWLLSKDGAGSRSLRLSFVSAALALGLFVAIYLLVASAMALGARWPALPYGSLLLWYVPAAAYAAALVSGISFGAGLFLSGICARWIAWLALLVAVLQGLVNAYSRIITYLALGGRFGAAEFGRMRVLLERPSDAVSIVTAFFWIALGVSFLRLNSQPVQRISDLAEAAPR